MVTIRYNRFSFNMSLLNSCWVLVGGNRINQQIIINCRKRKFSLDMILPTLTSFGGYRNKIYLYTVYTYI